MFRKMFLLSICITILLPFQLPFISNEEILVIPAGGIEGGGEVSFENVSMETGLEGIRGNFFSWGDYDNDGYQDLLIDGKKLFRNTGPPSYSFSDQTSQSGIASSANSGVFGDYDNDGWLDIFCGGGKGSSDHPEIDDILWHNERDGTFSRVPISDSVPHDTYPTVAGGWSDTNRDGYLDLYMANYENSSLSGYHDHFWMGNGGGKFVNATSFSGISEEDHPYQGRGISWCDFDDDGFQDAYVSNYRIMPNYLYRNLGNGSFLESAPEYGVEGHGNLHPITRQGPYYGHSLGSSWGDMDNDGDMDLWVTNLAHKDIYRGPICDDSYLFENLGPEEDYRFTDVRERSGIPVKPLGGTVTEGDELMVSSALADYDNDGDLDLFIPQIYGDVSYARSLFYRNKGDMTFEEVSDEVGTKVWNTYGSAWCDYDNDGWVDLITGGGAWNDTAGKAEHYSVHLYRNLGGTSHPEREWLEVELKGRESNAAAIGARVRVHVDADGDGEVDLNMMRDVNGGTAAHGQQDSMILHFGLGQVEGEVSVTVDWPRGRTVHIEDVSPSTRLELFEPTDPIDLDLEIISVEEEDDGILFDLQYDNPGGYDIDSHELSMVFDYGYRRINRTYRMGEIISSSVHSFEMFEKGLEFAGLQNVHALVTRSFPPVRGIVESFFYFSSPDNQPPVAVLSVPPEVSTDEEIKFDASSSYDPDGEISEYMFDFGDGTGTGWTEESLVSHSYRESGSYGVTVKVRDAMGLPSNESASETILVLEPEDPVPEAIITKISPEEAQEGETVEFSGEGYSPSGSRIKEYEWSSSIDGMLSRRSSFEDDDLSPGEHEIMFRVKDSEDIWSDPDIGYFNIISNEREPPWVSIDPFPGGGTFNGSVMITGKSGPEGEVELVEVRVDSGSWRDARGTQEWEYLLDTSELEPGREHSIQARSYADRYYSDMVSAAFFVEDRPEPEYGTVPVSGGGEEVPLAMIALSILTLIVLAAVIFVLIVRKSASGRR